MRPAAIKLLVLLAAAFAAMACSGPKNDGKPASGSFDPMEHLLNELERVHFYEFAAPDAVARLKEQALQTKDLFADEALGRRFALDKAALAGAGAGDFLRNRAGAFLKAQGVRLDDLKEDRSGGAYRIQTGGKTYSLLEPEEAGAIDQPTAITARLMVAINAMLKQANSQQRVYLLNRPDGSYAIFLRPELYAMIQGSRMLPASTKPMTFL